jgi:hypothetical protein
MFEAQILISTGTGYSVYSPWFVRGGDNALIELEVLQSVGDPVLTAEVATKENDAAGAGTVVGNSAQVTGTGSTTATQTNVLKDFVRYKFTISGDAGDWVLFRMKPIEWFNAVGA